MGATSNLVAALVSYAGGLYLLAVLLRFLLQLVRADFYNPVSQAVIRYTNPPLRLMRRFIPGYKGLDFSALLLALAVELLLTAVLVTTSGYALPGIGTLVTWSVVGLASFLLNIFYFSILILVIMSFVMLFSGSVNPHPVLRLVWQLTEPVMAPVRKILPPMGGLDFSPMLVLFGIFFLRDLLARAFGISPGIAAVIVGI